MNIDRSDLEAALVRSGGNKAEAARILERSSSAVKRAVKRHNLEGFVKKLRSDLGSDDSGEMIELPGNDDFVEEYFEQTGIDPDKYRVVGPVSRRTWGRDAISEEQAMMLLDIGYEQEQIDSLKQSMLSHYIGVKVEEKFDQEKARESFESHLLAMRTSLVDYRGRELPTGGNEKDSKKLLYELGAYDFHLGSIDHVDDPDSLFLEVMSEMLVKPRMEINKLVLVMGNDFLNFDTIARTTTAGTPQSADGSIYNLWGRGFALMVATVEEALRLYPQVEVKIVPGNHDEYSVFTLGQALKAYFRSEKRLFVDAEYNAHKYLGFGINLIGFHHGDKGKPIDLALNLLKEGRAQFTPQQQAEFRRFEVHCGHKHTDQRNEFQGVKIRRFNCMVPTDFWHRQNLYVGNEREIDGLVWHQDEGRVEEYIKNLNL